MSGVYAHTLQSVINQYSNSQPLRHALFQKKEQVHYPYCTVAPSNIPMGILEGATVGVNHTHIITIIITTRLVVEMWM